MARFKRTAERHEAAETVTEYVLELRPGHTISRVDHTSRLGAGRKGRAAEVSMWRELTCTCGGHLGYGGLTVAEDLAHLRHFDSAAERDAYTAEQAAKLDAMLKALGRAE